MFPADVPLGPAELIDAARVVDAPASFTRRPRPAFAKNLHLSRKGGGADTLPPPSSSRAEESVEGPPIARETLCSTRVCVCVCVWGWGG